MINYSEELIEMLKQTEKEAIKLNHSYVGSEHFLLAILNSNHFIKNILNMNNITYKKIYNEVKKIKAENNYELIYTPLLKKLILYSSDNNTIDIKTIFKRILESSEGIAFSLLLNQDINIRKLYNDIDNYSNISYGNNLNKELDNYNPIYGREKEINELIETLSRKNKNNPILIGEAGVGKTALVEELAYRINNKKVPINLFNKQIISINMSELLSGTKYRGEFEEKLNNLIKEIESNDNYILFIDEIHTIVKAGAAEGAIDASNILKPYLARNKIKCIGSTTIQEYNDYFLKDKALNRRFYPLEVKETNNIQTIEILKHIKNTYEKFHNVKINNKQIEYIVNISNKLFKDRFNPDKSIDLLDKICTKAKLNNNKYNLLIEQKEHYLKEKNYIKAKQINKLLSNNNITITNKFITSCINNISTNKIGFKTI